MKSRVSLRTKWTLVLLLLSALPIVMFAAISLRIQRRGLEDSERALGLATIDHTADGLERHLNEVTEVSHWAGRTLTEGRIADPDLRIALAREAIALAPSVAQVAIYDAQGKRIDAIDKPNAEIGRPADDLGTADRDQVAQGGRWLAAEPSNGPPVQRYVEALATGGVQRGYLVSRLDGAVLSNLLSAISQARFDDPRRVLLVDRQFRAVAGGDPSRESPGKPLQQEGLFTTAAMPTDAFAVGLA